MSDAGRVSDLLLHLIVSCNRLSELRDSTSLEMFLADYRVHELALRFIESLGEAVRRIDRLEARFLDDDDLGLARQIVGMRNRIAHQYDGLDFPLVWQVVVDYAPKLRAVIVPVLLRYDPNADRNSLHF